MFVGMDVSLEHLNLAAAPEASSLPRRVPNTREGIAQLVPGLTDLRPTLIVLKATGSSHQPLLAALLVADLPVSVINPAQAAAFRAQHLDRTKPDRADAELLARVAELRHTELRRAAPQERELAHLRLLVGYRDDLIARQTAAHDRRRAVAGTSDSVLLGLLESDLAHAASRLVQVERKIEAVLAVILDRDALTEQGGVGP